VSRDPRSVVQFILGSDDRVSLPQPSSSICRDIFITFFIFQVHSRIIDLIERNVRCLIHRIDVRAKPRIAGDRDGLTTCNDPFRFLSPRFVFRLERESRCIIISCERFGAAARVKRSLLSKIISVCRRHFLDGRITSRHDDCIFSRNEEREKESGGRTGTGKGERIPRAAFYRVTPAGMHAPDKSRGREFVLQPRANTANAPFSNHGVLPLSGTTGGR